MRLNENRKLAWIVLAVCVLGSIFGLGGAKLSRERDRVERMFYDGADSSAATRRSMDAYLDRAAECAQIMSSELNLRLGDGSDTAGKMAEQLEQMDDERGVDVRYAAYNQLKLLSDEAYNAMYAAQMGDEDRVNFKRAYDDFWGCDKYVRIDPYRAAASSFNDRLDDFPASLVAGLVGVDELNSFGA